jgi:hypothetical protein
MLRSPAIPIVWAVVLGAWALFAHADRPESVEAAGSVLLAIVGFLTGLLLGRLRAWLPGLGVAAVVGASVLATLPASLSGSPLAPPAGYGNADGMLLLCAGAGLLVSAMTANSRHRLALLVGAAVCAGLCSVIHAEAATVCAVALLGWFVVRNHGRAGWWLAGSIGALTAATVVTVLLGSRVLTGAGPLAAALSRDRVHLWRDAVHITAQHLLTGAGPGTFPVLSPTARSDADLAWTHSAPLQFAAALGLVGLVLFAGLVASTLWMLRRQAPIAALLLLPATIDYVLDFPAVVVSVAVVGGGACAAPRAVPSGRLRTF